MSGTVRRSQRIDALQGHGPTQGLQYGGPSVGHRPVQELQYGGPAVGHRPLQEWQYEGPAVAQQGDQPENNADSDYDTYKKKVLLSVQRQLQKWFSTPKGAAEKVIYQQNAEISQLNAEVKELRAEVKELREEKHILAQIKQLVSPLPNATINFAAPSVLAQNMPFPNNATYPSFANDIGYGTLPPDNTLPMVQPGPQFAEGDPLNDLELPEVEEIMQKFLQNRE